MPAKPEEPKAADAVTGNDITAPPNKELPPSPEKKTKVGGLHLHPLRFHGVPLLALLLLKPQPQPRVLFSEPPLGNRFVKQTPSVVQLQTYSKVG